MAAPTKQESSGREVMGKAKCGIGVIVGCNARHLLNVRSWGSAFEGLNERSGPQTLDW